MQIVSLGASFHDVSKPTFLEKYHQSTLFFLFLLKAKFAKGVVMVKAFK